MMSQDLRILKIAPLAFLKKYNVSPPNNYNSKSNFGATPNPGAYFTGNLGAVDSILKMKAADRIAFAELIRGTGDGYQMKMYLPTQLDTAQQAEFLPVWYLPWKADNITKMKIPHKQNGVDTPDIFFTSSLSGCSIFVEGPANNPTVYHAGSDNSRDWAANPKLDPNTANHWRILFNRARPNAVNVGEANKQSYLVSLDDSPEMQHYMNFLKSTLKGNLVIRTLLAQGSVFGIRDPGGNWSFYLQHKLTVEIASYTIKKKLFGPNQTIQGAVQHQERPMTLTQIFPVGAGHAKIWNTEPMVIH